MNKLTNEQLEWWVQQTASQFGLKDVIIHLMAVEMRESRKTISVTRSPIGGDADLYGWHNYCPGCNKVLIPHRDDFCPGCGVHLNWET